ncbi:MAG: hypothetical protein CSB55_02100 [Candidatus Cloacimonadota bacterium]|nr:MAG: hypothetical protein CSB55_02100 [Candidatus Cloacimonadota bacterium]
MIYLLRFLQASAILIFQAFIAPTFNVFGVTPNLFLPYVMFLGFFDENKYTAFILLSVFIAEDLLMPELLGLSSFMLLTIFFVVSFSGKSVNKDRFYVVASLAFVFNLFYGIFFYLFGFFRTGSLLNLIINSSVFIIYNSLFTVFALALFYFMSKLKITFKDA